MASFPEMFKYLRTKNSKTQSAIADYLKVTPRTIRFYETGDRKPDFDGLLALADYFDVSLDYLVGRTDNPNSHKP